MNYDLIIGGLISLGSSMISIYFVELIKERRDIKKERRELYADFSSVCTELVGIYLDKAANSVICEYQGFCYRITNNEIHKQECVRVLASLENNYSEMKSAHAKFRKNLALYHVMFGQDETIEELAAEISSFGDPIIDLGSPLNLTTLEEARSKELERATNLIRENFERTIIEFLKYLRKKVVK